jgi:hypothetical protein
VVPVEPPDQQRRQYDPSWEVHVIRKIMWVIFVLAALADCSCSPQNVNEKNFAPSAPANAVPDPALKALRGTGPEARRYNQDLRVCLRNNSELQITLSRTDTQSRQDAIVRVFPHRSSS